jgi:hypothetical protein
MNFKADIEAKIVLAPFLKKATLALVYVLVSLLFAAATFAATAAGEADAAEDASPCSNTPPFQIMAPGYTVPGLLFVDGLDVTSAPPHFQAFVTAVMGHINSRLAREKLCIDGAKSMESMRDFREKGRHHLRTEKTIGMNVVESMESMDDAKWEERSLLQFVHWKLYMGDQAYTVLPVMTSIGGRPPPSCSISSPWIDLVIYQAPVPQIRGIVYWNERQLLVDQAMLVGARDVLPDRAMPLSDTGIGYFWYRYRDTIDLQRTFDVSMRYGLEIHPELTARMEKANKVYVPPELLWLFHRSRLAKYPMQEVSKVMKEVVEKGADGYTKLVTTLIDRCFASGEERTKEGYYRSIIDVADPVLLEQYKIDMPRRH